MPPGEKKVKQSQVSEMIRILTKKKSRQSGGFGAKVNVINYNG